MKVKAIIPSGKFETERHGTTRFLLVTIDFNKYFYHVNINLVYVKGSKLTKKERTDTLKIFNFLRIDDTESYSTFFSS